MPKIKTGEDMRTCQKLWDGICPCCGGAGKIRMMQACAACDGGTVRGPDKYTVCPFCKGTGRMRR